MTGYKTTVCYFKQLIIEVVRNEHPATCGGVYGSFLPLWLWSALSTFPQSAVFPAGRQDNNIMLWFSLGDKLNTPHPVRWECSSIQQRTKNISSTSYGTPSNCECEWQTRLKTQQGVREDKSINVSCLVLQSAAMEETVIWEQHTVTLHRVSLSSIPSSLPFRFSGLHPLSVRLRHSKRCTDVMCVQQFFQPCSSVRTTLFSLCTESQL